MERVWRSLGSAGGRLRLCALDIRDEPFRDTEAVHGVWVLDDDGAWRLVHEAVVDDMKKWYYNMLRGIELAVDYAGAGSDAIVVDKDSFLLRYDLESGDKVELGSLHVGDGKLGALYCHFRRSLL